MSIVKKIATLSLGQGINILVNFLFLPYMARALDYSSYGNYGQTILVVTLFSAILSAGLSQIIFVYLNSDKKKETLSNNVLAGVFLGATGTIILLITSPFISRWLGNPVLETLIYIYSFSLVFIIPNQSFNSFLIFSNKVKTSMKLILSINLLKIFLVVIAIQLYQSVFFALLGIVFSQFILFFINVLILKDSLILVFNFKLIFEQIKKGFPLGLTALAGTLILYTDGIMISKMCGVETYAIYRNGAIEVPFISTLYGAVAAIILPEVAKLFSQGKFKEIATLKKKIIMNTMMITYPVLVFLIFNSEEIILIYLGEKYQNSAIIFQVFNLTLLMRVNDYHDILISANQTKKIFHYYLIVFIFNALLNFLFINYFGALGAATSTVISLFLFAFLLLRSSLKIIKLKLKDFIDFKPLCFLFLITLPLAFFLEYFLSFTINIELKLFLFSLVFFSVVYYILASKKFISSELIPNKLKRFL